MTSALAQRILAALDFHLTGHAAEVAKIDTRFEKTVYNRLKAEAIDRHRAASTERLSNLAEQARTWRPRILRTSAKSPTAPASPAEAAGDAGH